MTIEPIRPVKVTVQSLPVDFLRFHSDLDLIEDKNQFDAYLARKTNHEFNFNLFALPFLYRYHVLCFQLSIPQLKALRQLFCGSYYHPCLLKDFDYSQALFIGENALGMVRNLKNVSWEEIEKVIKPSFASSDTLSLFKEVYENEWVFLEEFFRNHRAPIDLYFQFKKAPELLF